MYRWLDVPIKILTGNGPIWGLAIGEVAMCLSIRKISLKDVLLIPDLAVDTDLLSISALLSSGFSVHFNSDNVLIKKNDIVWEQL